MNAFNEKSLLEKLNELPKQMVIAFATAAATRQLRNYERYACELNIREKSRPRQIVNQIWNDFQKPVDSNIWSMTLDEVMSLLPEENGNWNVRHVLAEDALSSLAYSIRCLLVHESQEAVWAARCAYEAVDQAAIRALGVQPGQRDVELAIQAHYFVQRELERQSNDLVLLQSGLFEEVQQQAFVNETLTADDLLVVV